MGNTQNIGKRNLFVNKPLQLLVEINKIAERKKGKNNRPKKLFAFEISNETKIFVTNLYRFLDLYNKVGIIKYKNKIGKNKPFILTAKGKKIAEYTELIYEAGDIDGHSDKHTPQVKTGKHKVLSGR